jgi:hypothetical protein
VPAELVDERKRGLVRRLNRSCVDPWEHIPLPSVFFLPIRGLSHRMRSCRVRCFIVRCTCAMCQSVGAALL